MDATCAPVSTERPDSSISMLTDNAKCVLESRYLARDQSGAKETPTELFFRVANHVANAEESDIDKRKMIDVFYKMMVSGKFMPNSPTLMNAGRRLGMLSACFVLPVPDDTKAIFKSINDTATIQKAGGGTGFAFDELRPCGAFIASSGGTSSGPLSFWRVFSEATSAIQQGSFRRGANMAIMSVDHPDIIKFLHAKQDLQQFVNFNISVKVTDDFMHVVREHPDSPFLVKWGDDRWMIPRHIVDLCKAKVEAGRRGESPPRELDTCYGVGDLIPVAVDDVGDTSDVLTVGEVMGIIVQHAWNTGEPGMFFIDRVRETEATPHLAKINACNPCGEQPLMANEACNLGSINLGLFIKPFYDSLDFNPYQLDPGHAGIVSRDQAEQCVQWDELKTAVRDATRFLDNVVSVNKYPTPEIDETCNSNRKIGLGVMGFADALLKLGVRYDSDEGIYWGERFMKFINEEAIRASQDLAETRGSFPWFEGNKKWTKPMRNACVTTVAPTGTISIIADCSGGVEPWFSFVFMRQVLEDSTGNKKKLAQFQTDFQHLSDRFGFASDDLTDHISSYGTLQDRDDVPIAIKHIFRTARDIDPIWHVKMQAAFQRHVTSAVSKTINLPADATVDDVRTSYMAAHEHRCKGVTVYRDGAREAQPMALKDQVSDDRLPATKEQESLVGEDAPAFRQPVGLPQIMPSIRLRHGSTYGNLHMQISLEPTEDGRYREREVFFHLGRSGDGIHEIIDVLGRLCSMLMRLDCSIDVLVDQLHGHASKSEKVNGKTGAMTSLPNELAMGLLDYYKLVEPLRDEEGFLSEMPLFSRPTVELKKPAPVDPVSSNGNGHTTRSHEFVNRIVRNSAQAGTLRQPCSTRGCAGELVYSEGCRKCMICGEGSC